MNEKNYAPFYQRITRPFVGHPGRIATLKLLNGVLVLLMYLLYPYLLFRTYQWGHSVLTPVFLKLFFIPALSFLVLSVFRHKINRPRPYEAHAIVPLLPRNKQGESMPSRHVFSAALISMCWLYVQPQVGVACLFCSLLSGVTRVLAGVHYPSDVAAGFDIGVLCGLILWAV